MIVRTATPWPARHRPRGLCLSLNIYSQRINAPERRRAPTPRDTQATPGISTAAVQTRDLCTFDRSLRPPYLYFHSRPLRLLSEKAIAGAVCGDAEHNAAHDTCGHEPWTPSALNAMPVNNGPLCPRSSVYQADTLDGVLMWWFGLFGGECQCGHFMPPSVF